MKRYAFIYNPAAAGGKSIFRLEKLEQQINQLTNVKLFRSQTKGDIVDLVEQIKGDFDVFVACGGDGTVREIAAPLISTDKTLGIVPMGTGNDLCKTLNIPTDLDKSLEVIFNGKSQKIDVGRCNDHIFLNSLGFGFDGLTNRYASELQQFPSFLKYVISALKATIYHSPFKLQITTRNKTVSHDLIMATFANGRVEGSSFWIAPEASVTDGKLNLITIDPVARWIIPFLLPFIMMKKSNWLPQVTSTEITSAALEIQQPVEIHADGEVINTKKDKIYISLEHKELDVLIK